MLARKTERLRFGGAGKVTKSSSPDVQPRAFPARAEHLAPLASFLGRRERWIVGMDHSQETGTQAETFLEPRADASHRGKMRDN